METVYLQKLEPSVLRPIELIRINGTCEFEPKFFPLEEKKKANVKVVWITGTRRKEIVRFGIRSADGTLYSSVWKCVTEKGRAKSDLYLIPQGMGSAFKVSLHESGEWHMGFTSEYAARPETKPLCANNAETPYPCYISVEGRDEKEDGKKSNGYGGSRGGDPDDEWRRA
jgi:hypothetical protein